jgi:bifunctional non-homologous end joining protein LigD
VLAHRESFVVGGWRPGEGARRNTVTALLIGSHDTKGRLRYAGAVGSGLAGDDVALWQSEATRLGIDESPFAGRQPAGPVRFLRPELVIDVEFRERTPSGTLRHPTYKGLRPDIDSVTVHATDDRPASLRTSRDRRSR